LIPRAKFSYFVNFSASVLKRLWVNRTSISITSAVLFSLSMSTIFGCWSLHFISYEALSQHKIILADPATVLACIYSMAECFYCVAYTLWQSVCESFLPVGCVSRDMQIQIVMSTQLLRVKLLCPLYYHHHHHQSSICWTLLKLMLVHV